ncbi:hypothetical protein BJ165DRAFT_1407202 [Panaeolus papilionaceus]|nr:hypothetical protein BJ165DRAFT_1407202 [Panaeolus papilionaceus]
MQLLAPLLFLVSLATTVLSIHEADVGVVDWHKHLIGVPLITAPVTVPSFHSLPTDNINANGTGSDSIILTATGSNVFAALNVDDGSVLWRYIYEPEDGILGYYKSAKTVATLSGLGGSTLRIFNITTGGIQSKNNYTTPPKARSPTRRISGNKLYFHRTLRRSPQFTLITPPSTSSDSAHPSPRKHCTGPLSPSPASSSPQTLSTPKSPTRSLGSPSSPAWTSIQPIPVWLESGIIRYVVLGPELKEKTRPVKWTGYEQLIDVGMRERAGCVVMRADGSAFVLKFEGEVNSVRSLGEIGGTINSDELADSLYAGGVDAQGEPFVTRVYWSHKDEIADSDIFNSQIQKSKEFTFEFDTKTHGVIAHVAFDPTHPRLLITTSTGALQLWSSTTASAPLWTREEALASIAVAEIVELPERAAAISLSSQAYESYFERLGRHVWDLHNLPQYIVGFVNRFVGGGGGRKAQQRHLRVPPNPHRRHALRKIYGIDTANGAIVWSRVMGLGVGGTIGWKTAACEVVYDERGWGMLVLAREAMGILRWCWLRRGGLIMWSLVDTVAFHINAVTGTDATGLSKQEGILEGHDVIQGSLFEAYLLNAEDKIVVMLDEFLQVFLYPENDHTQEIFRKNAHKLSFPLKTNIENWSRVMGHQVSPSPVSSSPNPNVNVDSDLGPDDPNYTPPPRTPRAVAHPTWSLTLPPSEVVLAFLPPTVRGPVAPLGKVLGDRRTLYKYLNPWLFVVTSRDAGRGACGVRVVDAGSGAMVYHGEVGAVGAGRVCDVKVALVENWVVDHYYDERGGGGGGGAKGYRVVSVEISDLSAYSNDTLSVQTYEESFVFPYGVTALGATTTKYGISSRDLIVATNNHRIQSFPRSFLDPRRPHRKPTSQEMEEGLMQYDPLVIDDPRRVLSHRYDVCRHILTSPSILKSTLLVFAHGLDLFLTRTAPSNTFDVLSEGFNKAAGVDGCGAVGGIAAVRPVVRRKKLRGDDTIIYLFGWLHAMSHFYFYPHEGQLFPEREKLEHCIFGVWVMREQVEYHTEWG